MNNHEYCCNAAEEGEDCDCSSKPKGAWIICPHCEGDGKHSKRLGAMTSTEFHDCFDDEESREAYFSGAYDETCDTCRRSGKIREDDEEALGRLEQDQERERIAMTGRNDAGEWVGY